VLGRVFGVVECSYVVTTALGSAVAGAVAGPLGLEGALLATAVIFALLMIVVGNPLARLEASVRIPEDEFALLRGLTVFAPLPIATLETLAARLDPVIVTKGDVIVREGDPGDRCYVVAAGTLELSKSSGWRLVLHRGDLFGELALLRDAPRNATATATSECLLLVLGRADFLTAVTGHARTQEAADVLVRERSDDREPRFDGGAHRHGEVGRARHQLAQRGGRQDEQP
jgi:CRP-like cAMP-binding protein